MFNDNGFTKCSRAHAAISFIQSCLSQSGEPQPILTCERLHLLRPFCSVSVLSCCFSSVTISMYPFCLFALWLCLLFPFVITFLLQFRFLFVLSTSLKVTQLSQSFRVPCHNMFETCCCHEKAYIYKNQRSWWGQTVNSLSCTHTRTHCTVWCRQDRWVIRDRNKLLDNTWKMLMNRNRI